MSLISTTLKPRFKPLNKRKTNNKIAKLVSRINNSRNVKQNKAEQLIPSGFFPFFLMLEIIR